MLEKKDFERQAQFDEMNNYINEQEDQIAQLRQKLEFQAKKEQAAFDHARLNKGSFALNGQTSFVSVSGGHSFVVPSSATEGEKL